MFYLQSFFSVPEGKPYSVARWQPNGFSYPEIDYLKPLYPNGRPIKNIPPGEFLQRYVAVLKLNRDKLLKDLELTPLDKEITFCCWCNEKRQKKHDKLFCHTILIGYAIEALSEHQVSYMDGRYNPVWTREDFQSLW